MNRRIACWCAVAWCCLLPRLADAQATSPAKPSTGSRYAHEDEREVSPVPRKAIDDALADLLKNLSEVKPKAGPLDTKELEKALREQLQGLKPPKTLKVTTSGIGRVVDPKDTGLYWDGLQIDFSGGAGKNYVWKKWLDIDQKKYALSAQPLCEFEYEMIAQRVENTAAQPFGRSMRLSTDYSIVAKVTLTFAPDAMENGTVSTCSGVGGATPESHTLTGTVTVADRVER